MGWGLAAAAVIGAGIQGWSAYSTAQSQRKAAKRQRRAARRRAAAVSAAAKKNAKSDNQLLDIQEEALADQLEYAEQNADWAREEVEDQRVDTFRNLYQQERSARGALAAGGSRGGSAVGSLEREVMRTENRSLETFARAHEKIDTQEEMAEKAYDRQMRQIGIQRNKIKTGLQLAQAGVAYNVTMANIRVDAVNEQTQYSWLTGALSGASQGIAIYGAGASAGWWGSGGGSTNAAEFGGG